MTKSNTKIKTVEEHFNVVARLEILDRINENQLSY